MCNVFVHHTLAWYIYIYINIVNKSNHDIVQCRYVNIGNNVQAYFK